MTNLIVEEYYSVGGNRHSAAADWSTISDHLAFGADNNIAIWSPTRHSRHGISAILKGHTDKVTAVKFLKSPTTQHHQQLVGGSADGRIVLWKVPDNGGRWEGPVANVVAHSGTVNTIATFDGMNAFATGGADGKIKLWRVDGDKLEVLGELNLKPRCIPLALALSPFSQEKSPDSAVIVVGGTRNDVQVYSAESISTTPRFTLCATLTGHEGWIRSLSITTNTDGGLLLASASQDKYIRIWRFRDGNASTPTATSSTNSTAPGTTSLTAKVQTVSAGASKYLITFEALLLGHEDWVYSTAWNPKSLNQQLLTASADGSLSIWEADPASGVWVSISRLGEISSQKGATTATGSSGGFWTGLWSPNGDHVTCLGRTGSWRLWTYNSASDFWTQTYGVSGHIGPVNGVCWAPDGSYLLSTSSDQTTRLHAQWSSDDTWSWHEFSRPQIHGYDLNCISSITAHQFASGADEKLLRVFNKPRDIAAMLHRLCKIPLPTEDAKLPDTAAIPVLGLSNKATDEHDATIETTEGELDANQKSDYGSMLFTSAEPPTEDLLARHTLWPEEEKLYGHTYEISEGVTSTDGKLLMTACKASSIDNAVIRLYETDGWNEIKPPLAAHSLTITRLAHCPRPPGYILSVGRDRQWAVFQQSEKMAGQWTLVASNPKAHTRMILDCAWLMNVSSPSFVTAGRDKSIKVWSAQVSSNQFNVTCGLEVKRKSAVTAVAVLSEKSRWIIAAGEDDGSISIHVLGGADGMRVVTSLDIEGRLCPSATVSRLAWRPRMEEVSYSQLAVASADGSIRILRVNLEQLGGE
ncbi:hypothetical protein B0A52_06886 [Exophiala mesophila]|uniref:Elongator complex protein 2 n=1 Tax=Exophiala mesophila TaxID=212818 RepID=A0A438N152_EXOME|nr:hypothetical protein B0A52_06886 [Exophiala mesophila]